MKKQSLWKRATAILLTLLMFAGIFGTQNIQAAVTTNQQAAQTLITMGVVSETQANADAEKYVTRQQFAKLLTKLSGYENKVADSVKTSLYRDVKKKSSYAPYIKLAVDQGWMKGNLSGKFRPKQSITAQEAANAVITLLGYDNSDFGGNKQSARWAFYKSEKLNANISKTKSEKFTYKDVIQLFYNTLEAKTKDGQIYAQTLGYTLDSEGKVDVLSLIDKNLKGPIIATGSWSSSLPFALAEATIYIGGAKKTLSDINEYDVIYYHTKTKTIYVFQERVTGKLEGIQPNTIAPVSVTVKGVTYTLTGQEVRYALSAKGTIKEGEYVTLLLGKDGTVVGVGRASDINSVIGGVVIKTGKRVSEETSGAKLVDYIEVLDTTGNVRTVEHDEKTYYYVNQPVEINYVSEGTTVTKVSQTSLTGTVNATATAIGNYGIAVGARIVEYNADGSYAVVERSRLAGCTFRYGNVLYYHLNAKNEITDMVVRDVTGDSFTYGILLTVEEINEAATEFTPAMCYGTYEVLTAEGNVTYSTSDYILGMAGMTGPVQIGQNEQGKITSMRRLSSVQVTSVTSYELGAAGKSYPVAEGIQVYLKNGNTYYPTTLSKVQGTADVTLTAYYDNSATNSVRILVVTAK
ncbi:MAG: S-layer homology domain-containing protein [Agathobacter sp.]|nr:S-layer homology domain-containing protein [Agathobacter sp.]